MGKGGNPLFSADRPRRIQMNIIAALKTVAVVAVSLLLISCAATVPVMTDEYDAQAEAFEPKQGEANIYVVRDGSFAGSAVLFQIMLDGKIKDSVAPGTYLLLEVNGGPHTVAVMTRENVDRVRLEARAGSNYFIEVEPKMGWLAARVILTEIDASKGRRLVIEGKRAEMVFQD